MRMFGILSVERSPQPGTLVRNWAHGSGDVTSRAELFERLATALPDEWQREPYTVTFFYAEPDDLSDDGDGRFSTPAPPPAAEGGAR